MFRRPVHIFALAFLLLLASCDNREEGGDLYVVPRSTEISADGGSVWVTVTASGSWIIDLEYPGGEASWATMDPSSGEGSRSDIRMRYDANDSELSRSVALVLRSGTREARALVTQIGVGGEEISEVNPNGFDKAPYGWLELPATREGDGLMFFAHNNDGGKWTSTSKDGIRNWSMYWDGEEHMALWVAYPLNKKLIGNGTRTNAWGLDPLIPYSQQPNLTGGSYGGGWTRGHQIPSADRLTFAQNISTFYGTNMTPQQYDFNGGIWAQLEGKVRSYAGLSDTLYVVTGCQYAASTQYTGNSSGFYVKVPTHYFKALLYKGNSTYASSEGYMAAGFLLPHDMSISYGNCLDYIMTVDELEAFTGIDFFPNLSALIGREKADAVEALEPSKWWK